MILMRTRKKNQLLHKVTTFVTLFALVFTFSGFAGGGSLIASPIINEENDADVELLLKGELIENRGEFEKHFVNEDGTVTAYSYANPIHYQDKNGNWIDIDNTLIRNADGFTNTDNPNEIRLSAVAKDNNLVRIKQGEYELSWGIQGARNVQGYETDKPEKTDKKDLVTLVSKVAYDNVFENTSLAYTLYSYSISEDLIFYSVPSFDQVTYNIGTQNLSAAQEGNEIIFFSTIEEGKEIFRFKAPFMYDSAFALTYNITVALQVTDGGHRLTYMLDRQWLESEERVYPVTLDPTERSWQHYNNVEDTHFNTWYPNSNYVYSPWLFVGQINGWSETWLKITTMPPIPAGSTIIDSRLEMVHCIGTTTWGPLNIWELTSYWNSFTLTYNNQWSCSWNYLYGGIGSYWTGSAFAYSIDVTNTVKKWYNGTMANWGFALAYQYSVNDYNALYSSDHGSIYSSYLPAISVTYVLPSYLYPTPTNGGNLTWPIYSIYYYLSPAAFAYTTCIADAAYNWVNTGYGYNNLWPNTRDYNMSNCAVDFLVYDDPYNPNTLAYTYFFTSSGQLVSPISNNYYYCEIWINDASFSQENYTYQKKVIIHEFGHVWGLAHNTINDYSIMYPLMDDVKVNTVQQVDHNAFNLKHP